MYNFSYLDIKQWVLEGKGEIDNPPPTVSSFSSTLAGKGLTLEFYFNNQVYKCTVLCILKLGRVFYLSGLHQTNNYLSQEGSKS